MPFFFFLDQGKYEILHTETLKWEDPSSVMGVFYREILKIQMKERKTV